jgi:hypothetical protein
MRSSYSSKVGSIDPEIKPEKMGSPDAYDIGYTDSTKKRD